MHFIILRCNILFNDAVNCWRYIMSEINEWAWNIGGKILTGGSRSTGKRKPVPIWICSQRIPHELTQGRTRTSAVRGRRLTAWKMFCRLGFLNVKRWPRCEWSNGVGCSVSSALWQTNAVRCIMHVGTLQVLSIRSHTPLYTPSENVIPSGITANICVLPLELIYILSATAAAHLLQFQVTTPLKNT